MASRPILFRAKTDQDADTIEAFARGQGCKNVHRSPSVAPRRFKHVVRVSGFNAAGTEDNIRLAAKMKLGSNLQPLPKVP